MQDEPRGAAPESPGKRLSAAERVRRRYRLARWLLTAAGARGRAGGGGRLGREPARPVLGTRARLPRPVRRPGRRRRRGALARRRVARRRVAAAQPVGLAVAGRVGASTARERRAGQEGADVRDERGPGTVDGRASVLHPSWHAQGEEDRDLPAPLRAAALPVQGSVERLLIGMLTPMLKSWLDESLPRIIERAVEREAKKLAGRAQPPRQQGHDQEPGPEPERRAAEEGSCCATSAPEGPAASRACVPGLLRPGAGRHATIATQSTR